MLWIRHRWRMILWIRRKRRRILWIRHKKKHKVKAIFLAVSFGIIAGVILFFVLYIIFPEANKVWLIIASSGGGLGTMFIDFLILKAGAICPSCKTPWAYYRNGIEEIISSHVVSRREKDSDGHSYYVDYIVEKYKFQKEC